jgi:hypothetical protein
MDMESFFDADTLQQNQKQHISLTDAPLTAQQYLQQVALDRQRCPTTVSVDIAHVLAAAASSSSSAQTGGPMRTLKKSRTHSASSTGSSSSLAADSVLAAIETIKNEQVPAVSAGERAPPREWQNVQVLVSCAHSGFTLCMHRFRVFHNCARVWCDSACACRSGIFSTPANYPIR